MKNVIKNKIVKTVYKSLFYFNLGRDQAGKIYGILPEIIVLLGGAVVLFDIDLSRLQMTFVILSTMLCFYALGVFIKKTGLYDTELYVNVNKNPVRMEILEAARRINKRYK